MTTTVRAGAVDITVTSTGKIHDLVLAGVAGGSTGPVYPGQTVHLRVTLAAGTYHFRCTYHPGMAGTLTAR